MPISWKWTEVAEFGDYCAKALPNFDISDLDLARWSIEDTTLSNPIAASLPLYTDDQPMRYFRTHDSPRLTHLPPLVIVFRIDREPTEFAPGEVTGLTAVPESEFPS